MQERQKILEDLVEARRALIEQGTVPSVERLQDGVERFGARFGPERLRRVEGEALLELLHGRGENDSLVYWLEFKEDDDFSARSFGTIFGGSSLKFRLYRSAHSGEWVTGSSRKSEVLTTSKAVALATKQRDQLLAASEELGALTETASPEGYERLQRRLREVAPLVEDTAWGHKTLYLWHPTKMDFFHVRDYQDFNLRKLLIQPPSMPGRFVCAAHFVALAAELELNLMQLSLVISRHHGKPYSTWLARIDDAGLERALSNSLLDLPRPELGDLSAITGRAGKASLQERLCEVEPELGEPEARRLAEEYQRFAHKVTERDVVLLWDGERVRATGRYEGSYRFDPSSTLAHQRDVAWLDTSAWTLPKAKRSGVLVSPVRDDASLIEVERRLLHPTLEHAPRPKPALPSKRSVHVRLPGVPGQIQRVLERKGQVILHGPPGTGKTYWALRTARELAATSLHGVPYDELSEEQQRELVGPEGVVRTCSFHPAYGYEDFLEAFRPELREGKPTFTLRSGLFRRLCEEALKHEERRFVLIIDEINRGDVPRIMGELLTLLERDKRGLQVSLPLSGDPFCVPPNVFVIGTMNTADRSVALLDAALRRRFGFLEFMPEPQWLGDVVLGGTLPLGKWLRALNRKICAHVGRHARNLQIGHAYFMEGGQPIRDVGRFARALSEDVIPLLEEYCYEDYGMLQELLGSALVDVEDLRVRREMFEPAHYDQLLDALLVLDPKLEEASELRQVESDETEEDELE